MSPAELSEALALFQNWELNMVLMVHHIVSHGSGCIVSHGKSHILRPQHLLVISLPIDHGIPPKCRELITNTINLISVWSMVSFCMYICIQTYT